MALTLGRSIADALTMEETARAYRPRARRHSGTKRVLMALAFMVTIAMAVAFPIAATASASTPSGVYWGATIGTQFTGSSAPWDMNSVTDFSNQVAGGKALSLIGWGSSFYSTPYCGGYCSFQETASQNVVSYGAIPLISWETTDSDSTTQPSGYTDAQIAAGAQDAYITAWAQAAKAWGHPIFLRFDWEMNGKWFPWSPGVDGNTAASYVAMWRHVHNIFTSVAATNVTWVWCPNIDPGNGLTPIARLYPGNRYVDWTGLDGYNGNTGNWNGAWDSFASLYSATYARITGSIAPGKPLMVAEVGSTETGGSKAQWITDMFSALPTRFPAIRALMWYDVQSSGPGGYADWPLESLSASRAAFAAGIASSKYKTNQYSALSGAPILVPAGTRTTLRRSAMGRDVDGRFRPRRGLSPVPPRHTKH